TNPTNDTLEFAPFLLTPSVFPRKQFEKAVNLQTTLNELVHAVAYDDDFLTGTLQMTIQADDFTKRLFDIYKTVKSENLLNTVNLGVLRSDYMLHSDNTIKQVEINTVASSFGAVSSVIAKTQKYIMGELGFGGADHEKNLPVNSSVQSICRGMIRAWELYNNENSVIVFIVENLTMNICDQRILEFHIRETNPKIQVLRLTLTEMASAATLDESFKLKLRGKYGDVEVALVYFRAGYEPNHYPTEDEWNARLMIERSRSLKCPSINYHLAGTKKVQQALAVPGILKRFINDEDKIRMVEDVFTGLYPLESLSAYEMAMNEPGKSAWILMDRIVPPTIQGYVIRSGTKDLIVNDCVSELGIFGIIIDNADNIFENYQAGHMLRTKLSTVNEGGVAAGLGAVDTPYLIDDDQVTLVEK
uniref:Glutathione synthetase n=1 Tax=Megaselia scalaris TaxID=36166 RepID=T1GYN1_MEGSC